MRALVVGATGFLGLNVVDALLARGVEVRATRRPRSLTIYLRRRDVEMAPASLDDPTSLAAAMRGCDAVIVAGAHHPRYSLDRRRSIGTGVAQMRTLAQAAREAGAPRIVHLTTTATLRRAPPDRPADERDLALACPGDSTHRATKWRMESELDELAAADELDVVSLLCGACIGPHDVRGGVGALMLGVVTGALPWWVDGTLALADVGDVAEAAVSAALHERPSRRYCVVGRSMRLADLLSKVSARYGGRAPGAPLSGEEACARADREEAAAAPRRARVPFSRELVDLVLAGQPVSSARASAELGVRFRPVDQTLDRAWAWFVRHRRLPALRALQGVA